jgi:carboxyl-terminal processing protease
MKNYQTKYKSLLLFVALSFSLTSLRAQSNGFEVIKNMELMDLIYQNLDMYFVDDPQPGKLSKVGIDAMLKELDPYTVYYHENDMEDYRLMTTGQYGGIGSTIRKIKGNTYIIEPYENSPSAKAGLKAGDQILSIDGKNMKDKNSEEVSTSLKGPKGTTIQLEIQRDGKTLMIPITRDEIKLPDVPYSGIVKDGIGYIKLNSFTQTAASDVEKAFNELKAEGMKELILDLRGNGGGLLIEAVKIVNLFVKRGQTIVTTKGRVEEENRTYKTMANPTDLNIPLTVLVDENSASASEIVAGSLQDLDRAVIIGTTSYGKGLVQRIYDLKYGSKMKLTVAKYYTPSGRCVQKLEYYDKADGSKPTEIADSLLKKFKTANGREVIDGRGIEPDIAIDKNELSRLTGTLYVDNIIFDYATKYAKAHESIADPKTFKLTESDYADFKKYVLEQEFTYSTASEEMLKKMKTTAEEEGYYSDASDEYAKLMAKVVPSKERDLEKFKSEIIELLENEIVSRYYYQKGRVINSFHYDDFVEKAIEILNNPSEYSKVLKP